MSYPNNAPNMMGRENPQQYGGYIDLSTGLPLDALAQNGLQNPFGYDMVSSGVVMPNYHMMDGYRQAALSQQQQINNALDEIRNAYFNACNARRYRYTNIDDAIIDHEDDVRKHYENLGKGDQQFRQRNYALAVHYYNQALRTMYNPLALTNKSSALVGRKMWSEALMAADTAIEIDPEGYIAYNNKAIAMAAFGQREDALAQYVNHAIPNDPKSAVSRNNAGVLLIKMYRD